MESENVIELVVAPIVTLRCYADQSYVHHNQYATNKVLWHILRAPKTKFCLRDSSTALKVFHKMNIGTWIMSSLSGEDRSKEAIYQFARSDKIVNKIRLEVARDVVATIFEFWQIRVLPIKWYPHWEAPHNYQRDLPLHNIFVCLATARILCSNQKAQMGILSNVVQLKCRLLGITETVLK